MARSVLTSHLFTCDQLLLSSYSSIFPCLFLPKPPWSLPFSTFGSSPKYPVMSCAITKSFSHNVPHTPGQRSPAARKVIFRNTTLASGGRCPTLTQGLRLFWDSCGINPELISHRSYLGYLAWHCASLALCVCVCIITCPNTHISFSAATFIFFFLGNWLDS